MVGVDYKDTTCATCDTVASSSTVIPYDYVIDDRDGSLGIELGVYGAPETFLLNAAGEVVYKRVGDINIRIWENELLPRFKALEVEVITQAEALQGQPTVGSGAGQ